MGEKLTSTSMWIVSVGHDLADWGVGLSQRTSLGRKITYYLGQRKGSNRHSKFANSGSTAVKEGDAGDKAELVR